MNDLKNINNIGKIIVTKEKPLSIARKNAVCRCDTSLVALIDNDIRVPRNWLNIVLSQMNKGVGAVSTVADQNNIHVKAYDRIISCFIKLNTVDTSPHINNVLVRRKVFENYNPPRLFFGEDFHFRNHVINSGFKWVTLPYIGAVHLGESKNHVTLGEVYNRYNLYSKKQFVRRCFSRFLFIPFATLINFNVKTFFYLSDKNIKFLSGWFKESVN